MVARPAGDQTNLVDAVALSRIGARSGPHPAGCGGQRGHRHQPRGGRPARGDHRHPERHRPRTQLLAQGEPRRPPVSPRPATVPPRRRRTQDQRISRSAGTFTRLTRPTPTWTSCWRRSPSSARPLAAGPGSGPGDLHRQVADEGRVRLDRHPARQHRAEGRRGRPKPPVNSRGPKPNTTATPRIDGRRQRRGNVAAPGAVIGQRRRPRRPALVHLAYGQRGSDTGSVIGGIIIGNVLRGGFGGGWAGGYGGGRSPVARPHTAVRRGRRPAATAAAAGGSDTAALASICVDININSVYLWT